MPETCDRCGPTVRAAYRAVNVHQLCVSGQLYLCEHCSAQLTPALRAQGWTIWPSTDGTPGQPAAA